MPVVRGRPRIQVSPCRFCHKTFKRQEHLQRHERIRGLSMTRLRGEGEILEKSPSNAAAAKAFQGSKSNRDKGKKAGTGAYLTPNRDLLVRHRRLVHASQHPHGSPTPVSPDRAEDVTATDIDAGTGDADDNDNDDGDDDGNKIRDQLYAEDHDDTPVPDQQQRQQQQQQHPSMVDQQPHDTMVALGHDHVQTRSVPPHIQDRPELTIDASTSSSYMNAGNGNGLQPLMGPSQPAEMLFDPMLGVDGSPDLEILWNDVQGFCPSLPNDFFDTDFSITNISQRLAFNKRAEEEAIARTMLAMPETELTTSGPSDATGTSMDYRPYPTTTSPARKTPQPATTASVVSRLPSLEPNTADAENDQNNTRTARADAQSQMPWRVSAETHRCIADACAALHGIYPLDFTIPSRHTLARYLEGYFRGFHEHMPFLHGPTFSAATASPELVLALAAVGALYRFEHAKGYEMYKAADAIVGWRLGQTKQSALDRLSRCSPYYAGLVLSPRYSGDHGPQQQQQQHQPNQDTSDATDGGPTAESGLEETRLSLLQAMIVLMALSSWGDRSMVPASLSMSSHMSVLAQELGLETDSTQTEPPSWHEWIAAEERRRTLFVAYVMTNLQSVAFNVPPSILTQDVGLLLPASGAEWNAPTARAWTQVRLRQHPQQQKQRLFRATLDALVEGTAPHCDGAISAFGNYLLMHGLLQQIFFARQVATPRPTGSLSTSFIKRMVEALRAWQESWEATHESTLDPSSPKGPLGFNSTALLRLAHIRLNANVGTRRELITRDSQRIAAALIDTYQQMILADGGGSSGNTTTPHLDRAVLQCIHAFSVPVRVGIAYVARTQTLNWSIQHALSNLECAMLLLRWLRAVGDAVAARGFDTLYADQVKLLNMTFTLVRETSLRDDVHADDLAVHASWHDQAQAQARRIRRLAAAVASLWAETFRGFHVFEMVYVIGAAMSIVSDTLNRDPDAGGR